MRKDVGFALLMLGIIVSQGGFGGAVFWYIGVALGLTGLALVSYGD